MDTFKRIAQDFVAKVKSDDVVGSHVCEGCHYFAFMMGAFAFQDLLRESVSKMSAIEFMHFQSMIFEELIAWEGQANPKHFDS